MSERSERTVDTALREAPAERSEAVRVSERSERTIDTALREALAERSEAVR